MEENQPTESQESDTLLEAQLIIRAIRYAKDNKILYKEAVRQVAENAISVALRYYD